MKLVCAISFLLILSSLSSCVALGVHNHFWLAQMWPGSFCSTKRCTKPTTAFFTIHGLWPTDAAGDSLTAPPDPPLQNATLSTVLTNPQSPLMQSLNKYWPDFLKKTNMKFWQYEWDKHASTQNQLKPLDYFQKAITLRNKFDIVAALKAKDVVANGSSYPVSSFINALNGITGKQSVMLRCFNNALAEVRICVNGDATSFIACNAKELAKTTTSCGVGTKTIKFPPP